MRSTRFVILIALAMLAATAYGDDGASRRYLVATRERPAPELTGALFKSGAAVTVFRSVDGFAASLNESQVARLRGRDDVLYVEEDPPRFLFNRDFERPRTTQPRAEPEAGAQQIPYGVDLVKAPALWAYTRGAGVRVGIVDTGIDLAHPDLIPNIDGGRSFLPGVQSFDDDGSHGTHVAGTVGGADNAFGVVGVAPEARLVSLRVFKDSGTRNEDFVNASAVIEVIDWAIENDVTILNMSFGGPESSLLEAESLRRARENGIIVAAAVGNTGDSVRQYPAAYPEAFGVGAVDSRGQVAAFSTRGSFVDVVAPGVSVRSTVPGDDARGVIVTDSVLGEVEGILMAFSPRGVLEGEWVDCGIGRVGDFPAEVRGRVALIRRGDLFFAEKAKNAKSAGATAVVIYNNQPGPLNGRLADDGFDYPLTIGISLESGEALLSAWSTVFETSEFQPYAFDTGTSMASPHVAGAAALLRALAPDASSAEIEEALKSTARDLGDPGYDILYGHGLIDVEAAARKLAPERFAGRKRPVRR
jgi:subtilisin family serine protease